MTKFFDLNELKKSQTENLGNTSLKTNYLEKQHSLVSDIMKEIDALPKEGEIFDLISIKSFNAFTLILWLLHYKKNINSLYISTYSMSRDVASAIFDLYQNGLIKQLFLFISDSMRYRNPFVMDNIQAMANGDENVKVKFGWNHTKISLCETIDKEYFTITGSGNFSKNAQYENYIIRNDSQIYDFYQNWFQQVKTKE